MNTKIAAAVAVLLLAGASVAARAQPRYSSPPPTAVASARTQTSRTQTNRTQTSRTQTGRTQTNAGRLGTASPLGRGRVSVAPVPRMTSAERHLVRSAATNLLRASRGAVTAPRGATRDSMRALLSSAWAKATRGGDGVRSLDSVAPGGHTRTVWVHMGEETGEIVHDRATPERETLRHIVIRYYVAEGGPAVLRSIEPSGAPPDYALPVPERVHAR